MAPKKPHYIAHRKRLRERFRRTNGSGLEEYELLELLLTYAIPRKDVKPLAKELLNRFGSITGVLDAQPRELEEQVGIGSSSSTLICLVRELCSSYFLSKVKHRDVLSSPQLVVNFARLKLSGLYHEAFMVIYLNAKNEVIDYEVLSEGTVDHVVVYPRRIAESALLNHAASLILVHNHPSGHTEPSEEDKELTRYVRDALKTLEIRVLDHIIVGKNGYFSFMENDLL